MKNNKVSIIIPSLNSAEYIRECIESALNQTLKDIEIICVDAGSTDGTVEILQEYAARDARIHMIHSEKKSYGFQMNLGMDAAQGEYLAILESDDLIRPDMYEQLYREAEKHRADIVKADYEVFIGEGSSREYFYQAICHRPRLYHQTIDPSRNTDVFNVAMMTWSGIYRLRFLRENRIRHNETPGASYQDNGFWFQTFAWAKRVYFLNKPFYMLRRDNPNSSVHNRAKVFCIFEEYAFIENRLRSDPEKAARFIGIFHKKKFDNCMFHYSRIGDEFKPDFLERMSVEFRAAQTSGELDLRVFGDEGAEELLRLIDHPEQFHVMQLARRPDWKPETEHQEILLLKGQLDAAKKELQTMQNAVPFKIGKVITFLPEKLLLVIRCLRDYGIGFTVSRILIALHLRKENVSAELDYRKLLEKSRKTDAEQIL